MARKRELSPIAERIIEWIKSKNMSVLQFENSIQASNSYIRQLKGLPRDEYMNKIIKAYPDFPVEYIVTGIKREPSQSITNNGSVGGSIRQINGSLVEENMKDVEMVSKEDYNALRAKYYASLSTIEKLRKTLKAMVDSMCGDNPTLDELGEK